MAGDLTRPITPADHHRGRLNAPLQLVVYGDYECPYTRLALLHVRTIRRELGDELCFVFRNFPLREIHPHAVQAAKAAEAAGLQNKFWEMHDWLFAHQRALTDDDLLDDARHLELDPLKFVSDRDSRAVVSRIQDDAASGEASGVEATPTLFVNGRRYDGSYQADPLLAALKVPSR
jgi:protein-disulfide isomerase